MRPQINRLPGDTKGFAGTAIDRSKTVRFRLDGRLLSGFAGDSVFTAALASGVDTLGEHLDMPVGLLAASAPAVSHASLAGDPQRALPMDRTPAVDGADLVTLGGRRKNPFARLFQPGRTLGLVLDKPTALERPWRAVAGQAGPQQDIVVIGAGVAGMSAALVAARAGLRVTLIENTRELGGNSGLFGTQEGEDSPEEGMARLAADIADNDAISVMRGGHVFAIRPGMVRLHEVELRDGVPHGLVLDLEARHIVLATGSIERLPLFAGNRLPGVIGSLEAYELARRYGIWPGRSAVLATGSNPAYRVSLAASDAGLNVLRLLDPRPNPNSRFIAFTRAHGMRHSTATRVVSVTNIAASNLLSVQTDPADDTALTTDRLVVCGGWQPDLTLWHVAGGRSQWSEAHQRIEAVGELDGIVLAGSAAGYFTRTAAIQSGADAIDRLLGRPRRPVEDRMIEPLHETPDARWIGADPPDDAAPTYLDDGPALLQRPAPPPRRWGGLFGPKRVEGLTALSEAPQPLTVATIAAGVDLGLIPPPAAGAVAQERVALVPLALSAPPEDPAAEATDIGDHIPDYLQDRFGDDAVLALLRPTESRRLEPGMLIYRSSDVSEPARAIGVVLRDTTEGALALASREAMAAGLSVSLRDQGRSIPARLEARPG